MKLNIYIYIYICYCKIVYLITLYHFQSVVILSRLPFNNLFNKVVSLIAPEYFDNGELSLEAACYNVDQWPSPEPGVTLSLPLLGTVFQVRTRYFKITA